MSLFRVCAIVASNAAHASQIRAQIALRIEAGLYPREIEFRVLCDPERGRVGSGGAVILAAHALRERLQAGDAVLLINAGGESRRMPTYAPEGKLFAPLPLPSSSRIPPIILDEQLRLFFRYPWNPGELVVASGDVTISFDETVLPRNRRDIYGFAKPDTFELGSQHGVFKFDRNRATVIDFFQKENVAFLRERAALEGSRSCALDMGMVGFSPEGIERLLTLAASAVEGGGTFAERLTDGSIGLDLYVELLMALLPGMPFDRYCAKVRSLSRLDPAFLRPVHDAFQGTDFPAFLTRRTQFFHFGSLPEYSQSCEDLASSGALPFYVSEDAELRPFLSEAVLQFNSVDCSCAPAPEARHVCIESCERVHLPSVGGENLLVGMRDRRFTSPIPRGICVDERDTPSGRFLLSYGIGDTWRPRQTAADVTYCGIALTAWAAERGVEMETLIPASRGGARAYDLWDALLFVADADESFTEGYWNVARADASWRAVFAAARRFSIRQIVAEESLTEREERRASIRQKLLGDAISRGHGWLSVSAWDFRQALAGCNPQVLRAICEESDDDLVRIYRRALMDELEPQAERKDVIVGLGVDYIGGTTDAGLLRRSVKLDQIVWARSPVRLDLAGGWTDTPPFTLREGGEVVNVAVNLNDQPPIQVFSRPTVERSIRVHSIDLGVGETIKSFAQLEDCNRPGSPFALPKAALCLLGFTAAGCGSRSLEDTLGRIGCGIEITLLSAVPKGSGLGTSSILAATILGALERFFGLEADRDKLIRKVLQTEQMLTTGGGWQDQIGGMVGGVKYVATVPGLRPVPVIYQLDPYVFESPECASRFTLYYTGITRLAKNILQEVVGRVNSMEPAYLFSLRYLKELARAAREAISQRDMAALGEVLHASWEENKLIHPSTSNEEVDALLDSVAGLYSSMKLLGAGGGGFVLFLSDSAQTACRLRDRLAGMESERARIVDMRINKHGLRVTVS